MKKIFLILILSVFLISFTLAETSYCCEKTTSGAWCQNSPEENCDSSFRKVPTSCEATSYCKKGTCYDSQEGTCDPNTPQKACEDAGGVWEGGAPDELPQCQLGCCLIGDQASFVTQTRCKRLSLLYGLEINFKTNLKDEIQCIASATSDVKGACVFEKEFEKTCLFISQKECAELNANSEDGTEFHEGYLCSDETLGTNCGPTETTTCVEGRDEIYFIDSCGNLANIFDASKINDKSYWSKIVAREDSCGYGTGNANSPNCGNCDYYLGSTCKRKSSQDTSPKYGDNICKDLDCVYEGKKYKHGETWCADSEGIDNFLPGSRSFRMVCYNGEVSIEPCADYRQEVCLQSEINNFRTAACRVNRWQECYSQTAQKDCENEDKRDCQWIQVGWNPDSGDARGVLTTKGKACVPLNAPGFDFWAEEGDAQSLCSMASVKCVVSFSDKIIGGKTCEENCECLEESWFDDMEKVCAAIGDCGGSKNYIGSEGYGESPRLVLGFD